MKNDPTEVKFSPGQQVSAVLLFPFNLLASALELIFCIPLIGRLLKWLWNCLLTLLHFIPGMIEYLAWTLGTQPVKKLKVSVVVLSDETNQPVEDTAKIIKALERTTDLFIEMAKVKVVPAAHIPKTLANQDRPNQHWVQTANYRESKRILDVGCNERAILEDLTLHGASYQWINLRREFFTSFRRVFGYGAPVTIFIVRDVEKKGGCSLGFLSDYVTIPSRRLRCIPHELGHALGLFHRSDPKNLLYPKSCSPSHLTSWQIAVIRASRHVTII
jgi:hypothetical protein